MYSTHEALIVTNVERDHSIVVDDVIADIHAVETETEHTLTPAGIDRMLDFLIEDAILLLSRPVLQYPGAVQDDATFWARFEILNRGR